MAQSQTTLDIGAARDLAFELAASGDYDAAAALAQTLIKRDPNDHAALLALAQAQRGLGDTGAAVKTAKAAWRAAETDPEQYASATVVAQTLAFDGKRLQSQLWLRRAAQAAPNETLRETAKKNFKFIRARTPTKVQLSFSVAPTSNINNGSSVDTFTARTALGDTPASFRASDRPLSGIAYRFDASVTHTKPISERQNISFGGSFKSYTYSFSSEAKDIIANDLDLDGNPVDIRASDFAFQELRVFARTRVLDADGLGSYGAGLTFGRNWYGGAALTNFAKVDINRQKAFGKTVQAGVGLSAERRWRLDNDIRNATVWSLSGNIAKSLENGDVVSANARLTDTNSASDTTAHKSARIGMTYRFAEPVFANTSLELSLGAQVSRYDRVAAAFLGFTDERREDVKLNASATFVLGDLDYFGFSPTATIDASKTRSNVARYTSRNLGVSLGLRSSF